MSVGAFDASNTARSMRRTSSMQAHVLCAFSQRIVTARQLQRQSSGDGALVRACGESHDRTHHRDTQVSIGRARRATRFDRYAHGSDPCRRRTTPSAAGSKTDPIDAPRSASLVARRAPLRLLPLSSPWVGAEWDADAREEAREPRITEAVSETTVRPAERARDERARAARYFPLFFSRTEAS